MISQSNSIERFISELLIFVKLFLKINNKFFEAQVTMVEHVFFVFWDQTTWSCSSKFIHQTQLNTIHWIVFNWVRLQNSVKHNPMNCFQLCSVCLIEWYWFGNRAHSNFDVRFCWIAKLNQTQFTGWVWLNMISQCSIDYARMCMHSTLLLSKGITSRPLHVPECTLTYGCSNIRVKCVISES